MSRSASFDEAPFWVGLGVTFTGAYQLADSPVLGLWLMLCGSYLMFWAFR